MNLVDKLISEIECALTHKLYNLALISVLSMPEIICQSVKEEKTNSKDYIEWFNNYVARFYIKPHSKEPILNGNDTYALRCSILHQGRSSIKKQDIRKDLDDFVFFASHNFEKMYFPSYSSDKRMKIHIEEIFKSIVNGYFQWKKELSPELLKRHASYKYLEITEITEDFMDVFERALVKKS